MIDTLDITIENLKKIIRDSNCANMNQSTVKGYLGELLVLQQLKREGVEVFHKGNQSGFDLLIPRNNIKIDVKFSLRKNEISNEIFIWGWALHNSSKRRNISCTHFVCVALDNNLEVDSSYVINSSNVKEFPSSLNGQFKNVSNAYHVLCDSAKFSSILRHEVKERMSKCNDLLMNGIVKKVPASDSLSKALFSM